MGQGGFLADQIATAGHTVLQRDTLYHDATVFEYYLADGGIYRMILYLVTQIVSEEGYLAFQLWSESLWPMDMQCGRTSQQTESGNHTNQSETVIAMLMGDEYVAQFGKADLTLAQLYLRAFGTIEHQHLTAHLHHLRRCVMTKGGKRTSTP